MGAAVLPPGKTEHNVNPHTDGIISGGISVNSSSAHTITATSGGNITLCYQ